MKNSLLKAHPRSGILGVALLAVLASGCGGGGTDGNAVGADSAAGGIWLSWKAPTERENGSALAVNDLSGYRVYWGPAGNPQANQRTINDPSVTTYQINGVGSGTYEVAVSAIDSSGLESEPSAPMAKSI